MFKSVDGLKGISKDACAITFERYQCIEVMGFHPIGSVTPIPSPPSRGRELFVSASISSYLEGGDEGEGDTNRSV